MMSKYEEAIEAILRGVYSDDNNRLEANHDYSQSFQQEGERKTRFIINRLLELDQETWRSLEKFVVVSIGGADGTDLLSIIKKTPIKKAILLEFDNESANFATQTTEPLIKQENGILEIITGDANQQLDNLINKLKQAKKEGYYGVVLIFLGILHELPSRSPNFELSRYLSRATSVFENNCIFISEPFSPQKQQEELLEFRLKDISEDRLYELVKHINANLFNNRFKPEKISQGYVRAEISVVIETLHKLIRFNTVSRFQYEMGERLTRFTSTELENAVYKAMPKAVIELTYRVSEGFRKAYHDAEVEMREIVDNKPCPIPYSHLRICALNFAQTSNQSTIYPEGLPTSKASSSLLQSQIFSDLHKNIIPTIFTTLEGKAPNFLNLFKQAIEVAEKALSCANRANEIAKHTESLFVKEINNHLKYLDNKRSSFLKEFNDHLEYEESEKQVFIITKTLRSDDEERGVIIYDSYDQSCGQMKNKILHGLGVTKIYALSKKDTPNEISFFRGEYCYGEMGEYGLYEFVNGSKFIGKWIDNHPHFGIFYSMAGTKDYDIYFGQFGDMEECWTNKFERSWQPHGLGIGIKFLEKQVIYGMFINKKPSEDVSVLHWHE